MKLKLSLAQIETIPTKIDKNLAKAKELIVEAKNRDSEIIVFPEMWTTGFQWDFNRQIAKDHTKVIDQVANLAKENHIWITGSMLALDEDQKVTNTVFLFNPSGEISALYRKTHLFTLLKEDQNMARGKHLTTFDAPWGKTGLSVCYDIRFPEMFRTYALQGVKIVFSPIAFPHPRKDHWQTLLKARAIENQMFMVGVNRVGPESIPGNGEIKYFGSSSIIDPWGKTVIEGSETDEVLLTATIDLNLVDEIRKQMTVLQDRRPELYFSV